MAFMQLVAVKLVVTFNNILKVNLLILEIMILLQPEIICLAASNILQGGDNISANYPQLLHPRIHC
jgi:hypothetical protein